MQNVDIEYVFKFTGKKENHVHVCLDPQTLGRHMGSALDHCHYRLRFFLPSFENLLSPPNAFLIFFTL